MTSVLLKMVIQFAIDVSAAVTSASSAGFVINTHLKGLLKSLMMIIIKLWQVHKSNVKQKTEDTS